MTRKRKSPFLGEVSFNGSPGVAAGDIWPARVCSAAEVVWLRDGFDIFKAAEEAFAAAGRDRERIGA